MWADLHWASEKGYSEIVKILVESGENPNICDQVSMCYIQTDFFLYFLIYIMFILDNMFVV